MWTDNKGQYITKQNPAGLPKPLWSCDILLNGDGKLRLAFALLCQDLESRAKCLSGRGKYLPQATFIIDGLYSTTLQNPRETPPQLCPREFPSLVNQACFP